MRHTVAIMIMLVLGLTHCTEGQRQSTGDHKGNASMDLELVISLERASILVGEDTPLRVRATNRSTGAITIPDLGKSADWPQMKWKNLSTRQETTSSRASVAGAHGANFLVPLPKTTMNIEPGRTVETTILLSQISPSLTPGTYELSAVVEWNGNITTESPPLPVKVEPLSAASAEMFSAQSGGGEPDLLLYTAEGAEGAVFFLSDLSSTEHAVPRIAPGTRIGTAGTGTRAVASVTGPESKWPALWLLWSRQGKLSGEYLMQWRKELAFAEKPLGPENSRLVGPAYLDLSQANNLQPAPAVIASIAPSGSKLQFALRTITEKGDVKEGERLDLNAGNFVWGRAAFFNDNKRTYVLAIERGDGVDIQLVRSGNASPLTQSSVGHCRGEYLTSQVMQGANGTLEGCSVLRERPTADAMTVALYFWSIASAGGGGIKRGPSVALPKNMTATGAIASAGKGGNAQVIFMGGDGTWYAFDQTGKCMKLSPKALLGASPVGIYWGEGQIPYVLLAGRENGLFFLRVSALFDSPLKN